MIHDPLLTKLVSIQTNQFQEGAPVAQKMNTLMQIEERQRELKKENRGDD